MRTLSLFALMSLAIGEASAWAASGPADREITDPKAIVSIVNPDTHPVAIEDLFFTRKQNLPSWSHDGRWIVFSTNLTGQSNIYRVLSDGGWPIQLVQSGERQFFAQYSPDDKWILYQQDRGGNEMWDLYAVPAGGGDPIDLTNTPDISETNALFSPDGRMLAFNSKPKSSAATDIAVMDWATRRTRQLTHEPSKDYTWGPVGGLVAWSTDGKYVYAVRANTELTDSDIYRIDVATGRAENLTPHKGEIVYGASDVSPDGSTLLISSNAKTGSPNIALLNIRTRVLAWVTDTQWQADPGSFSPDGTHFIYTINHEGYVDTYLAARGMTSERVAMPEGETYPDGQQAFSPDGRRLILNYESPQRPTDFWIYDLASAKSKQLTFASIASLGPGSLPPAEVVRYKSFDGKIISAILTMPYNLKRDGSNPMIVVPHGGPPDEVQMYFDKTRAALASHGYICIAPNVRGSTGFGMAFQKANYQDLGGGDLQDEVYAVKWLIETGYVDPKKVGITGGSYGGSYGGYMTLMALGKTPDIWAAGVEAYGIVDWLTTVKNEDPFLRQLFMGILGDPVKDRLVYENDSPIRYLGRARAPLLVLQGDNDIRVPKEEAEQVIAIYRKQGNTVDAKFYSDEGHGFYKRDNQIDAIRRTLAWFDKYLKGQNAAP